MKVDVVEGSVDEDRAVKCSDLPEADRTVFEDAGLATGDVVCIGTSVLYADAQREASVLVPDPNYAYITWERDSAAR